MSSTCRGSARYAGNLQDLGYGRLIGSQNERHSYEKCQYEEFKERVKKMDELRAAKSGQRSN
jgi:hypothetical protein